MSERRHFGDTDLGQGLGFAAVVLAFLMGLAMIGLVAKYGGSTTCNLEHVEKVEVKK